MVPLVPCRSFVIANVLHYEKRMRIVTLAGRRPSAPSAPREWLFQTDLEDLLYPSVLTMGTAGAFYRLLNRSGGTGMSLPLRRNSVAGGLVTEGEFDALKAMHHASVRVFTLVPLDAAAMAVATYGSTPASEALVRSLGWSRPEAWAAEAANGVVGEEEDEGMEVDEEASARAHA